MSKTILIIDNDRDVLEVLTEALTYESFKVKAQESVDDIFKTIRLLKPDLLIVDYLLGGINGGEICHQVKSNPETAAIPVIIFSAYPRVLQSLGTYDCDAFVEKPFDLNHILHEVHALLHIEEPGPAV